MKHILTSIALLFCLGGQAQTIPVHLDTPGQIWYANIAALQMSTLGDTIELTQMRISFNGSVPGMYAWLHIGLYYSEPGTGRMLEYIGWTVQATMPGGAINPVQAAFTYARDAFYPNGQKLENILYIP